LKRGKNPHQRFTASLFSIFTVLGGQFIKVCRSDERHIVMIQLTRLNKEEFIVNADLIEFIEATPDTVITLLTGRKMMVREKVNEVVERVIAYRRTVGPSAIMPIDPTLAHDKLINRAA
jgi:flagellar protein FlbD